MLFRELKNLFFIVALVAGVFFRGPLPALIKISDAIAAAPQVTKAVNPAAQLKTKKHRAKKVTPGMIRPQGLPRNFVVAGIRG